MIMKVTDDSGDDVPEFSSRPYTIIVDTREQSSYSFRGLTEDKSKGGGTIVLKTVRKALKTGDYAIDGMQDQCAVERKSMEDFFHCVGTDRRRFEKQLERLNELDCAVMMIEAGWDRILKGCDRSKLNPKSVYRSVIAWQVDYYPNIHWWFCAGRMFAERTTFRILDRYWKGKQD